MQYERKAERFPWIQENTSLRGWDAEFQGVSYTAERAYKEILLWNFIQWNQYHGVSFQISIPRSAGSFYSKNIFSSKYGLGFYYICIHTHKSTTEFYLSKNCLHINSKYNHYIYFYQWHPFISSTEIPFYFIVLAYQALSSLRIVTIRNLLSGRPTFRWTLCAEFRRGQDTAHITLILELHTPHTHTIYMVGTNIYIRSIQIWDSRIAYIEEYNVHICIDWVLSCDEIRSYETEHEFLWR